ncbi:MAG: quercetin 2,3-dioxygenase [Chloroflexi bacterium]|nr:quercetin 2,3-dioxygenase [Chloroflexota bacterium]
MTEHSPEDLYDVPPRGENVESPGLLIPPDGGEAVWLLDELVTFKIGVTETESAFSLTEVSARPGGGPPLHVHHRQREAFYVLEGEVTVRMGGTARRATQGSFVLIPEDMPHTYRVVSRSAARLLTIYSPAGYEDFFREVGEAAQGKVLPPREHLPDMDRYVAGQIKYNSEILGPPLGPA